MDRKKSVGHKKPKAKKSVRKEGIGGKPEGLCWVPANNFGGGDWRDSDGNTWVERDGRWENWGNAD
jgi:hypothetical protein